MKKLQMLLILTLFICTNLPSQSNVAVDIWNRAVTWTNLVKKANFNYTIAVVHTPQNAILLHTAKLAHQTMMATQDSFSLLAKAQPEYAEQLLDIKKWIAMNCDTFGYEKIRDNLEGKTITSPREHLRHLKELDRRESDGKAIKYCERIFLRFAKLHNITELPIDTLRESQCFLTNRAIIYERRLDIIVSEASIYMSDYIYSFNNDNPDSMAIMHQQLLKVLPNLALDLKKTAPFSKGDRVVFDKAVSLIAFLSTFSQNAMPTQIGLKKKVLADKADNADIGKMNSITDTIDNKYNLILTEFEAAAKDFLQRYVPKKSDY